MNAEPNQMPAAGTCFVGEPRLMIRRTLQPRLIGDDVQFDLHGGEPLQWYSTKETPPQIKKYEGPADQTNYTPLVKECVRAAMGLNPPPVTGAESLHVLKTVFACYRAAETGQSQKVT